MVTEDAGAPRQTSSEDILDSYRRLAAVFHDVLSEQSLDALLDRIADTLADLVPYDSLTVYRADEAERLLVPVIARDRWAEQILSTTCPFGAGITGWAVEHEEPVLSNEVQHDPRANVIPGTPDGEPEALISVPLLARSRVKGALNVYRLGENASFSPEEFELATRFGDAAALAIDNAETRARLEHQAQTDSLTGLFNHRYFHERLRSEIGRTSRGRGPVAVLMIDVDDFKRVNDVYGHATGDQALARMADVLGHEARVSDVVCRLGGEEFGIIMTDAQPAQALSFARRIDDRLAGTSFDPVGKLTVSIGIAQAPEHAMNPRELAACAESAMMTAKSKGKSQIVVFGDEAEVRPDGAETGERDARSIAHLKMLQSLVGKLNRLTDVNAIGETIVTELRTLVDYHNGRVYLTEGDRLVPLAFRGELGDYVGETAEVLECRIGEGITGRVALTGRSVLIPNALECEYAVQIPGTPPIAESLVAVPLGYGTRVIGVLVISKLGIDQFDEDDVRLLEVLAGHASVALENARLYEAERCEAKRARESAEIASSLLELGRELAAAETVDDVLKRIVASAARVLGSPKTSIWLQQTAGSGLTLGAEWGHTDEERRAHALTVLDAGAVRATVRPDRPVVVDAATLARLGGRVCPSTPRYAVAALRLDAGRVGCLVTAIPPEEIDDSERKMRLLTGLADQAVLAIGNAGNYESLEKTFLSTVEALANALEANDEYTSSHARSLRDMALAVGAELELDGRALKRLELGALFHDIGKIGIPSDILAKPGPLTSEEREAMELHPTLGERILAPIDRLADVRPIVRHCHERYDGTGYPDGLSGEAIPLESRIIFVCDTFHAMTTDRPYRRRLQRGEACRRLQAAAGTQFDAGVVAAFLRVVDEDVSIAQAS